MTVLADLGVEFVVLDRYKMPGGEERAVTEALAEAVFAGHVPVYADERADRAMLPGDAQPYIVLGRELGAAGRTRRGVGAGGERRTGVLHGATRGWRIRGSHSLSDST